MKKKIINISLALILVLSVCLSVTFSASAESGNEPVAWVNFTAAGAGYNGNPSDPGHPLPQVQVLAKRLSDGSTTGHARMRFLKYDAEWNFEVVDSLFSSVGDVKLADILMVTSEGSYWSFHLEDYGKGKERMGAFITFLYWNTPGVEPPFPIDSVKGWYNPANPPPQEPGAIGWYVVFPYQNNPWIRIHITDAYQD